ncbi:hypothetical protein CON65_10130 [Bacillus pseudomycoides]|uniref:Uncharacterized protein n=1 Tax=Bacillus pseudomycoides TaxID=64104 RepID=A0AA91ZTM5_9BACI|nr:MULTISPECIES: hypothetical protein [Bacillus]PEB51038.1 hypothetical protein COO03_18930 [Bacillus sp. AFS098217]PED82764.1 hypothetical protein CON65_10130 [Bacillus pseudomycoides]PEU15613.1 hypothetical protein CN525_16955 [Bacillus sp. AFS014408]PEU16345.1 hypothetical protein CN524_04605 [Bacillus sp. AFS019443]PFW65182.1 hypothetical protein COL20_01625 [Bacillus sp. AFS075034]
MFQRVQTKEEHFWFEQLWGDFCEERDLMFVERNLNPSRFLLIEDQHYIGTVECIRYVVPEQSNSEFFYPFSENDLVKDLKNVYEIGKLSIAKTSRGRGHFKRLAAILFMHALEMKAEWYIAVVTKRMYMYLFTLGFPIEPIDNPFNFHDKLQGVPVRIHARKGITHLYSLKEFRDIIQGNAHAQALIKEYSKNIMLTN